MEDKKPKLFTGEDLEIIRNIEFSTPELSMNEKAVIAKIDQVLKDRGLTITARFVHACPTPPPEKRAELRQKLWDAYGGVGSSPVEEAHKHELMQNFGANGKNH